VHVQSRPILGRMKFLARTPIPLIKKRTAVAVARKLAAAPNRLRKTGEAHNARLWPRLSHQVKSV
jgi:hypothetical protein